MTDETKSMITLALEVLRKALIDGGVSIGMDNKKKELIFFDTEHYFETKKCSGFAEVDANGVLLGFEWHGE